MNFFWLFVNYVMLTWEKIPGSPHFSILQVRKSWAWPVNEATHTQCVCIDSPPAPVIVLDPTKLFVDYHYMLSNIFGYKAFGNGYYVGIKEPGGIVTPLLTGNHALPANGRAPEKGNRVIICCKLRSIWLFVGVGTSSTWPVPCVGCALNPGLPPAPVPENWSS